MWWQSQPESYVHDRLMRIYDLSEQVSDRIVARVDGAKTSRADLCAPLRDPQNLYLGAQL